MGTDGMREAGKASSGAEPHGALDVRGVYLGIASGSY